MRYDSQMHKFIAAFLATFILMLAPISPVDVGPSVASAEEAKVGRWVDFGKWNGVADCESSPNKRASAILTPKGTPLAPKGTKKFRREVRVDQEGTSMDRGVFQFIPSTWDWVSARRGKPNLIGRDPRTTTLATQLRQAEWLRRNSGIRHWTCGYRYNDGTPPRYVTGELKKPRKPGQCKRNLRNKHQRSWRVARAVCNTPNYIAKDFS